VILQKDFEDPAVVPTGGAGVAQAGVFKLEGLG
jgi:hypothetical protein